MTDLIENVLDTIFYEDLKFIRNVVSARRRLGNILIVIGFIMLLLPIFLFPAILANLASGGATTGILGQTLYLLIILLPILGYTFVKNGSILLRSIRYIKNPGAGQYRYFSKLECPKCHFTIIREKRSGEFVGDVTEEICKECNQNMIVVGIYAEPERKIKTIGYFPIPMFGQQLGSSIKALIISILSPFKLALRGRRREEEY